MWGPLGVFDEDVRFVPIPAATHSQQATNQPPTALTVDDVKAGLKAAREIVTEADGLRGQVKAMAQAELPPPTATPTTAKTPESKPEKPDIWDSPKNK